MGGIHDGGSVTPIEDEPMENVTTTFSCSQRSDDEHWHLDKNNVLFCGESNSGWAPRPPKAQLAQPANVPSNQPQSTPETLSIRTLDQKSSGPRPGDIEGSFKLLRNLS